MFQHCCIVWRRNRCCIQRFEEISKINNYPCEICWREVKVGAAIASESDWQLAHVNNIIVLTRKWKKQNK